MSEHSWLQSQPLHQARSLPAAPYVDADFVARDRRQVFDRGWQLVGHASRLSGPGETLACEIAGQPVVIVRDQNGQLKAFHNVCRHRAGPLAEGHACGVSRLRCRYHGWSYGLDGQLQSAPEMQTAEGFDPSDIRLPELRIEQFQGLLFASQDPFATLDQITAGIAARLTQSLTDFRFARRVSYEIQCNWKIYVDNYLEGYHVPHIHPELNRRLDYRNYRTELSDWHSLQCSPLEGDDALYGEGEALYYFIYPNTMLNILPGRLQTNQVLPLGPDRCRVDFDYYYLQSADATADLQQDDADFSDSVQEEDRLICEAVHRGLASGSYTPGRLNPLRESAVHHFHERLRADYSRSTGSSAIA